MKHLGNYIKVIDQLPAIKALVVWDTENEIPGEYLDKFPKIYKFKDFLLLGNGIS